MNKRAGYIALITLIFLILIAVVKLEQYTFLAFVAFPLGLLQQQIVKKTSHEQWRLTLLLENILGLCAGIVVVLITGMFYSIYAYLLLSTLATYVVSTQRPIIASTIFSTMGMMYATNMQPWIVFGMMLSGFALSQLATSQLKRLKID